MICVLPVRFLYPQSLDHQNQCVSLEIQFAPYSFDNPL